MKLEGTVLQESILMRSENGSHHEHWSRRHMWDPTAANSEEAGVAREQVGREWQQHRTGRRLAKTRPGDKSRAERRHAGLRDSGLRT